MWVFFFLLLLFFFFPFSARHGTREQCVLQNSLHRKTESTLLVTWGSQPVQGSYTSFLFICIREELGYSTMSGLFIRRKVKRVLKGNTRMCYTEVTAWGKKKKPTMSGGSQECVGWAHSRETAATWSLDHNSLFVPLSWKPDICNFVWIIREICFISANSHGCH